MKFDDICNAILERAFHGTPHDVVGSFDLQKIGSGEGAQAYGWGLYFAEQQSIALLYREKLSGKAKHIIDGQGRKLEIPSLKDDYLAEHWAEMMFYHADGDYTKAREDLGKWAKRHEDLTANPDKVMAASQVLDDWEKSGVKLIAPGNLYTVDIDADKENDFLDWDKPMSQQNPKIQNKLKSINLADRYDIRKSAGSSQYGFYTKDDGYLDTDKPLFRKEEDAVNFLNNPKGETIYREIDYEPKKASQILLKKGIKGIKYLDQGSRGTGEGTYNYVIFDPSIIKIVAKNGEFVMPSKKPENVEI